MITITLIFIVLLIVVAILKATNKKEIIKEPIIEEVENPYKDCEIEHFPINNKYFPKYQKQYIQKYITTGEYHLTLRITFADSFNTKEEALKYLDKYLELKDKKSQIIKL